MSLRHNCKGKSLLFNCYDPLKPRTNTGYLTPIDADAYNTDGKVRDVNDSVCYPRKGLEIKGISVLEIFSVTYLGCSPVEPQDQIGTICMETNKACYYLYYETKVDTSKPSIKYGDKLCIDNVGPICPFTKLKLHSDLFSGNHKGYEKVIARSVEYGNWLAKPSIRSIHGGISNISVLFGCFPNATIATFKVFLLPAVHSDATNKVYGVIMATNSKFDHPSCTTHLFSEKNPATAIQVKRHNGVIPLSKSRVGVPLDSQLYVDISLHCGACHYQGTAYFSPKTTNTDSYILDGQIQVKVTWNCNEDSNFTDEDSCFTDEDTNEVDSASQYEYDSEDYTETEFVETIS